MKSFASFLAASLAILTVTTTASAEDGLQQMLGTLSVEAQPVFSRGELSGCSLVYEVLTKDHVYKQGQYVLINGSVGLMRVKNSLAVTLKVVLNDWDQKSSEYKPGNPGEAFIVAGLKTTKAALISSTESDTPGGYFAIFQPFPTFEILSDAVGKNDLTIIFARKGGIGNAPFKVDVDVAKTDNKGVRTKTNSMSLDFFECNKRLIDDIQKSLK